MNIAALVPERFVSMCGVEFVVFLNDHRINLATSARPDF